jgi:hypothetical protein
LEIINFTPYVNQGVKPFGGNLLVDFAQERFVRKCFSKGNDFQVTMVRIVVTHNLDAREWKDVISHQQASS